MDLFTDFQVGRPLVEKLKLKHLYGVFEMLLFFGILEMCRLVYAIKNFYCSYNRGKSSQHNFLNLFQLDVLILSF